MTGSPMLLWIEALNAPTVLRLAWLHRHRRIAGGRYASATLPGRWLARVARWFGLLPADLQQVVCELGDLRDRDGRALRYVIEEASLRLVDEAAPRLFGDVHSGKAFLYLYKALAAKTYPAVRLACVAAQSVETGSAASPHLLLADAWAGRLLESAGLRVSVVDPCMPRPLDAPLRWALRLGRALTGCGVVLSDLFRVVVPGRIPEAEGAEARIAVQYCTGVDQRFRTDVFWLPHASIDPARILLYFNRDARLPGRHVRASLARQGLGWVSIPGFNPVTVLSAVLACRALPRVLWPGRRAAAARVCQALSLLREDDPLRGWREVQTLKLAGTVAWWSCFFRRYGAVAHLHIEELGGQMVAQSLAMDLAQGISVGYHWSHLFLPTSSHSADQTVYFAWGPYYESFLRRPPGQIGHLLFSGHVSCRSYDVSAGEARKTRDSLTARGVRYVIALFDSSFDADCHISRAVVLHFYQAVLAMVKSDRSAGLLIKPKNPDNIARLPEIAPALDAIERQGRCLVLDWRVMPGQVALASDLLVGLGINSAVIEGTLISGKPGLHWDLSRKLDDRLFQWGYGRVVFDDERTLIEAIHASRSGVHPEIGNHDAVLAEIDPYRDGKGASRIGSFLTWYCEARVQGRTRDAALSEAVCRYRRRWEDGLGRVPASAAVAVFREGLRC